MSCIDCKPMYERDMKLHNGIRFVFACILILFLVCSGTYFSISRENTDNKRHVDLNDVDWFTPPNISNEFINEKFDQMPQSHAIGFSYLSPLN